MRFLLVFLLSFPVWGARVLLVGDSHSVGPFGWELDRQVRSQGHSVASYASCGSTAQWWETGHPTPCGYWENSEAGRAVSLNRAATPLIKTLLETHRPDVVVVELSGNYFQASASFAFNDMRAFADKIRRLGARCFWITTPATRLHAEAIARTAEWAQQAVGEFCTVFDSRTVTRYPAAGGDGIHYWFPAGTPIAKAWAQAAFEKLVPLL